MRLYQIAFSDDNFDTLELQMLYKFASERGLETEQLNDILLNPSMNTSIPETLEKRVEYLYDLAIMIWADGKVTEDEELALKKYCKRFEFMDENIEELTAFLLENAKNGTAKEEILKNISA